MIIKTLLTLLRTPDPDAVLDKPFHYKGRFVSDTPDAVKHEHQQNIKLFLLFQFLATKIGSEARKKTPLTYQEVSGANVLPLTWIFSKYFS